MESSRSGAAASGDEGKEKRVLEGKRVLLAEDEESARKALASALRALGADVIEVADGGRMLVLVASLYKEGRSPEDIDLVVTDVRMPVFSGLEIFQGLRAAGWTTPVIVVTAYETPKVRELALRLDAALLSKPLDLDRFEETLRALMARPRRVSRLLPKVTSP